MINSFLFFRVGTKETGTRFLTFVDSVHGYRHLLQQADLDRALSLCTGMKGKLRARFIVLSDERVLPPPPIREPRGKRKQVGNGPDDLGRKRNRSHVRNSGTPVNLIPVNQPPPSIQTQSAIGATSIDSQGTSTASRNIFGSASPLVVAGVTPIESQGASGVTKNVFAPASNQGYFTTQLAQHVSRGITSLTKPFTVPPPIMEVDASSNQSSLEDWASAHSDDTIIQ